MGADRQTRGVLEFKDFRTSLENSSEKLARNWIARARVSSKSLAMRAIVDRKGLDRQAASTSQMGRFETEWLATDVNLAALTELSGVWIDRVHDRKTPKIIILDMDSSGCWHASFMAVAARQVTLMTDFVKRTKLSGIYCGTSLQTERWREI